MSTFANGHPVRKINQIVINALLHSTQNCNNSQKQIKMRFFAAIFEFLSNNLKLNGVIERIKLVIS